MALVPPTVAELAIFTGRQSDTFSDFAVQALAQATLLFYLATELSAYPNTPELEQLARNGILDMADNIYLSQDYREDMASPYQSESIGSYSYSKAIKAVRKGDATGIMWFDLAVNKLKQGTGIGDTGSIQGMEWDGLELTSDGKPRIAGAKSISKHGSKGAWEIDYRDTNRIEYNWEDVL
jgi:hypothetical protein